MSDMEFPGAPEDVVDSWTDLDLLRGRTVVDVGHWSVGGGAQFDLVVLQLDDESVVELATGDTEQYCSWLRLVVRDADG